MGDGESRQSSGRQVHLPTDFAVGALVGINHGGGTLMVWPGLLILYPGPLTRKASGVAEIRHSSPSVRVMYARAMPPWMNTRVVLDDGHQCALSVSPMWSRRRLLRALRTAGFEVSIERGWHTGADLVRPWT